MEISTQLDGVGKMKVRSLIEYNILTILAKGPLHMYGVRKVLNSLGLGVSNSVLYHCSRRLIGRDLIEEVSRNSAPSGEKILYQLTSLGGRSLKELDDSLVLLRRT